MNRRPFRPRRLLDTDFGNQIVYQDTAPELPNGNNVVALWYGDKKVDFNDASTYYRVSSVNYLAAGACNFSDGGKTLWPLDQIVADTQYYVRDAVIEYIQAQALPISPMVEGRLVFLTAMDTEGPTITIATPASANYWHQNSITLDFSVVDTGSGVKVVEAKLDNVVVSNGQLFAPYALSLGEYTFTVWAVDKAGNEANAQVKFNVVATVKSLKDSVAQFYKDGKISKADVYKGLMDKLTAAENSKTKNTRNNALNAFIHLVKAQSGKAITKGSPRSPCCTGRKRGFAPMRYRRAARS